MATVAQHFDRSALPPARIFYERELGEFRRPSRGWASPKSGCPFHQSKSKASFRVNLDSGGWVCFAGCGKGDMITFMRQRYGLSFKTACQELGCWREQMTAQESRRIRQQQLERARQQQEREARTEALRRERLREREHLHALEKLYGEARQAHDIDVMSGVLPLIREAEKEYCILSGLEVTHEK
jgi:CHC2 zinc finger